MKILAIGLIIGSFILGFGDGDCTGAIGIMLLCLPVLCEEKKGEKNVEQG